MTKFTVSNHTATNILVIVEPIANQYTLKPDEQFEFGPPLYIDDRKVVDVQLANGMIVLFLPEEVSIKKSGKPVQPDQY